MRTPVLNSPDESIMPMAGGGYRFYAYSVVAILLTAAFLLDLALGSVRIPLGDVVSILMGNVPEQTAWCDIVRLFRLPKAVTAVIAGAGLGVSGLLMQTLFRNPLAGPSVLGITAGAGLGVALVVLAAATGGAGAHFLHGLGLVGDVGVVAAASTGAALVMLMVTAVSRWVSSNMSLLILGILFGYAASALVSVLIHFSEAEQIQAYVSWTFGSFSATTWQQLLLLVPVTGAAVICAHIIHKPLNGLLLGETYARSMGLNLIRVRIAAICITATLTGMVTAFCGPVAFLGVAVPHMARTAFNTSDHRALLPAVSLMGALVAVISDIISQLPGCQSVLPLNAVTALIGTPVITWLIIQRQNLQKTFA